MQFRQKDYLCDGLQAPESDGNDRGRTDRDYALAVRGGRAALERARREEADCVMLTSSAARTAARSLYRKVGFVEAETSVFTLKREKI